MGLLELENNEFFIKLAFLLPINTVQLSGSVSWNQDTVHVNVETLLNIWKEHTRPPSTGCPRGRDCDREPAMPPLQLT